jgi:hypothetical protein
LGKLRRTKPDRWIELFCLIFVTGFSIYQWKIITTNNKSSSSQTDQLIVAAKINAQAAQQNALAASSFASTEEKINQDLQSAVGKLNAQAQATSDVATAAATQASASNTIASATQQSANTAHDALYLEQRPWVGVQIIPGSIPAGFSAGQGISLSTMQIIAVNSGRTPALRWQEECLMPVDDANQIPFKGCDDRRAERESKDEEDIIERNIRTHPNISPDLIRGLAEKNLKDREIQRRLKEQNGGRTIIPDGTQTLGTNVFSSQNGKIGYEIGSFVYYDALDPTQRHVTDYCLQIFNNVWSLCDFGQNMN